MDINDQMIKAVKNYSLTDPQSNKKLYAKQLIEERNLMKANSSLGFFADNIQDRPFVSRHLTDINPKIMEQQVNNQFFNINIMKSITDIIGAVAFHTTSKLETQIRLKEYLTNLRQIGAESVQGIAMNASFSSEGSDLSNSTNNEKLFVLKVPRDPENFEIIHEAFSALYGTNKLREFVPNFAYVFGTFSCSGPLISEKNVVSWCSDPNIELPYIVYENVFPSVSMNDFCKTATVQDIINAYLQVVYALKLANDKIGFVHNDLHYENVLIRQLDKKVQIPYLTSAAKIEFIEADFISTIIDYGMDRFIYKGKSYGKGGLEQFGIYMDRGNVFRDAYKFLLFTLKSLKDNNRLRGKLYDQFHELLADVYGTENFNLYDIIDKQRQIFYALPDWDIYKTVDMYKWAKRIRQIFSVETGNFISDTSKDEVISCRYSECLTMKQFETSIGLFNQIHASNSLQFYDLDTRKLREDQKQQLRKTFDIGNLEDERKNIIFKYTDLKIAIKSLKKPIFKSSLDYLLNAGITDISNYMGSITKLIEDFKDVQIHLKAFNYTAQVFKVNSVKFADFGATYGKLSDLKKEMDTTIHNIKNIFKNNKVYLEENEIYLEDYPLYSNYIDRFLNLSILS